MIIYIGMSKPAISNNFKGSNEPHGGQGARFKRRIWGREAGRGPSPEPQGNLAKIQTSRAVSGGESLG